ncbi:MAG: glycosyltransferase [Desulfovibrionaceae bacterium]
MRITLILLNTRGGGSIYAALNWANAWQDAGHEVSVIVTQPDEGVGPEFYVHPDIRRYTLDLADRPVRNSLMALLRLLRRLFLLRRTAGKTRPEVMISIDGPMNVLTLMACFGCRTPVIAFEQVHPAQYSMGAFWDNWREKLYPRAAMLLNLTDSATVWCRERFHLKDCMTIPNPVLPPAAASSAPPRPRRTIVAAGRMVEQKRFDLLINAFALTAAEYPDWDLLIYGDGTGRPDLERQVRENGLADRVSMPGWTGELSARLAECDFFVLSSAYEGFGNVIAEAMAVGLPVVSFDCPAGPSDIIRHEVDGLLVPPLDVPALAQGMKRLMADPALRKRLGGRAPEVLQRFSLQSTLERWNKVFQRIGVLEPNNPNPRETP